MHNENHNMSSKNQLMHNNNCYFRKHYIDKSYAVIILISEGNEQYKLCKRQAITPYQICDGNDAYKQVVCIASYREKYEK